MAIEHVVDTHALLWLLDGNPRLGSNAKAVMSDANAIFVLPIIALAEACWVVEHGKSTIAQVPDLIAAASADWRAPVRQYSSITCSPPCAGLPISR